MKKIYTIEREGQIDFFDNFSINYEDNEVLIDNTDGVWNGNLLEFKLNISDLNKVLFQTIKYLSYMRIKGESIPKNILLISLNTTTIYLYNSSDYFNEIHTLYVGAASKNNSGFVAKSYLKKYDYSNMQDALEIKNVLNEKEFLPIELDEDCIVGWAERYYNENPKASKGDFIGDQKGKINIIGEIREPKYFKGLILPYSGPTNEKFKYLMDKLNDHMKKKSLGAFYTPIPYCEKSAELVRMAIKKVPYGNDYVIIDRCAGTGNLESVLTDEELSHCILSTYEYYEYKVLLERLGSKVRAIIPPTELNVVYSNGCVINANAMSEEYIKNPILNSYVNNPKCTIILYENPPYHDESSGVVKGKAERTGKGKKDFVTLDMKREVKGVVTNDIANRFIWSAFHYYIRQKTDSYIVFSPIKYWKQYSFLNKKPQKAFLFNRKYFHATDSAISCILWENEEIINKEIKAEIYDIEANKLKYIKDIVLKKVFYPASKNYYSYKWDKKYECDIHCAKNGTIAIGKNARVKSFNNDDIIGYLEADSFSIDANVRNITRFCLYNGNGCYLTKENYIYILPIWVAKNIPLDCWYFKNIYATTSDGGEKYKKDSNFLKSCLIYTCLSNQNKCLTLYATDNKLYKNELCFDENTLSSQYLKSVKLDSDEQKLIELWNSIIKKAKKTKNYNKNYTYGIYQIIEELNTYTVNNVNNNTERIYDYPDLNGDLISLRSKLKEYYITHIFNDLFKYELVK